TVVRAHPDAVGARKEGPCLGRSRGGCGTNVPLRVEGRGRPRKRPTPLVGDKGYCSRTGRRLLHRGIGAVIPRRRDEPRQRAFDQLACRERNRIERSVRRLKRHRAIATRDDKLAAHCRAGLVIAAIPLWLSRC
ncbi:MAG: transposase, partial [Chloroflexota bacterium]|nr:transposase [Chloroflexota bacterium]